MTNVPKVGEVYLYRSNTPTRVTITYVDMDDSIGPIVHYCVENASPSSKFKNGVTLLKFDKYFILDITYTLQNLYVSQLKELLST